MNSFGANAIDWIIRGLTKTILDISVLCQMMMLRVGMHLEGGHFPKLGGGKGGLLLTLATQAVFLPALGLLVVRLLRLPPNLSAGILLSQ